MSVGGIVIEARPRKHSDGDDILVTVVDPHESGSHKDFTSIAVEPTEEAKQIKIGDSFWWQGKKCFWTPMDREPATETHDIEIPRAGYSHEYVPFPIEKLRKLLDAYKDPKCGSAAEISGILNKLVGLDWTCHVSACLPREGCPHKHLQVTIYPTEEP